MKQKIELEFKGNIQILNMKLYSNKCKIWKK